MCWCKYPRFGIVLAAMAGLTLALSACSKSEETTDTTSTSDVMPEGSDAKGHAGMMASAEPINAKCIMQDGNDVGGETIEFQGMTIGFCCADCKAAFEALSDTEKSEKVASMKEKMEGAMDDVKEAAEDAMEEGKDLLPGGGD